MPSPSPGYSITMRVAATAGFDATSARHATVVATGRSYFPNRINNVLALPGLFRGLFDAFLLSKKRTHP